MNEQEQTLASLIREIPNAKELAEIATEIAWAHDRTAALLIATQLEAFLERAIYTKLPRLTADLAKSLAKKDGPLNGFHAKILLATALGLIDEKTRSSLDTIREIRNAFAHAPKPLRFSTPQISKLCAKLGKEHGIDARAPSANEKLGFTIIGIPEDPNRQIMLGVYVALTPIILDIIFPNMRRGVEALISGKRHRDEDSSGGTSL